MPVVVFILQAHRIDNVKYLDEKTIMQKHLCYYIEIFLMSYILVMIALHNKLYTWAILFADIFVYHDRCRCTNIKVLCMGYGILRYAFVNALLLQNYSFLH